MRHFKSREGHRILSSWSRLYKYIKGGNFFKGSFKVCKMYLLIITGGQDIIIKQLWWWLGLLKYKFNWSLNHRSSSNLFTRWTASIEHRILLTCKFATEIVKRLRVSCVSTRVIDRNVRFFKLTKRRKVVKSQVKYTLNKNLWHKEKTNWKTRNDNNRQVTRCFYSV